MLRGGDGDDTIDGGGGDDIIDGGANQSNGTLEGGEGIDTLVVTGDVTLAEDGSVTDLDATGFENLTGSRDDNELTGNDGPNVLDGMAGNNTLTGALGDDIFVVWGSYNTERPSGEMDTIADFEKPGIDGVVKDVIHLRGFSADAMTEDDDDQATHLVIKDGDNIHRIVFSADVSEDDIDSMVGSGRGDGRLVIFVD